MMCELEIFVKSSIPIDEKNTEKLLESYNVKDFRKIPGFSRQYSDSVARLPENRFRNRYTDIIPYDHNRVQLTPSFSNQTGYINASHAKMIYRNRKDIIDSEQYIACQGPVKETCEDFWSMIWQQKVKLIVMVTGFVEDDVVKCFEYIPLFLNESVTFGNFQVQTIQIEEQPQHIRRVIELKNGQKYQSIVHIQHTRWPDHSVPESIQDFTEFIALINVEQESFSRFKAASSIQSPIVVHCSAGVGRTGVLIMCHSLSKFLESATGNDPVNIADHLKRLRCQRPFAVRSQEQFYFVCQYLVMTLRCKYSRAKSKSRS